MPFEPDPEMGTVRLGFAGDTPLFITPPCKESNFISFIFHGSREVARFALAVDDDGKLIAIMENGKVTTMKEIQVLAFRIVLGSERYEKLVADGWRVEEDPAAR